MFNLKTLCILLLLLSIFINPSAAQKKNPPKAKVETVESTDKVNFKTLRFESSSGNFSIDIFLAPYQVRTIEPEKDRAPGKQFFWQFQGNVYTVMYSPFNKNDLQKAFAEMNSGARKGIANAGGKLVSEKTIAFGKYPASEFRGEFANGFKYIGRNYLVDDVGYLLTAVYADEAGEKKASETLDSFKLLTEKK
jgi:hypothetical protein